MDGSGPGRRVENPCLLPKTASHPIFGYLFGTFAPWGPVQTRLQSSTSLSAGCSSDGRAAASTIPMAGRPNPDRTDPWKGSERGWKSLKEAKAEAKWAIGGGEMYSTSRSSKEEWGPASQRSIGEGVGDGCITQCLKGSKAGKPFWEWF